MSMNKQLNSGQTLVIVFDQQLFVLAKQEQWKWPDDSGVSVHVIMLGGLQTKMALRSTLVDILDQDGLRLNVAEVAS